MQAKWGGVSGKLSSCVCWMLHNSSCCVCWMLHNSSFTCDWFRWNEWFTHDSQVNDSQLVIHNCEWWMLHKSSFSSFSSFTRPRECFTRHSHTSFSSFTFTRHSRLSHEPWTRHSHSQVTHSRTRHSHSQVTHSRTRHSHSQVNDELKSTSCEWWLIHELVIHIHNTSFTFTNSSQRVVNGDSFTNWSFTFTSRIRIHNSSTSCAWWEKECVG